MNFVKERKSSYRTVLVSFNKPKPTVHNYYPSIVAGNAIHSLHLKNVPAFSNLNSKREKH